MRSQVDEPKASKTQLTPLFAALRDPNYLTIWAEPIAILDHQNTTTSRFLTLFSLFILCLCVLCASAVKK